MKRLKKAIPIQHLKPVAARRFQAFYKLAIEPIGTGAEERRRELIFNVIATSLFAFLCLLDLFVLYADSTGLDHKWLDFSTVSALVAFFGLLILISRKGHPKIASYLFIGFYVFVAFWSEHAWGTAAPLVLSSYGAVVVVILCLSNRELERSLAALEMQVEERTRELKSAEQEKVAQLYRFVEFGKLASGIFHDLLNPLSVVSLSVERLRQDKANAHIDRALNASRRIEAYVQMARKQLDSKEARREFSANAEVSDAINLLAYKCGKAGISINFKESGEIAIFGNPVKFFQVAVNLISNAIDSYDQASFDQDKTIEVSLSSREDTVRFSVKDKGCGIRESAKKCLFQPFFTTKGDKALNQGGFGLGLSTSKDIVEKEFKGKIEFESAEGRGSVFKVSIPLKAP